VVVDLVGDEDIVVRSWDGAFEAFGQWTGPGLSGRIVIGPEGKVPQAVEGNEVSGGSPLGFKVQRGLLAILD